MNTDLEKLFTLINEILVDPRKPAPKTLDQLDAMSDDLEIETKVDGVRCIVLKDPDDSQDKALSSSGRPLGGNYKNIFKELRPALDQGWLFSGEVVDLDNLDDRGQALSVARNSRYSPYRLLFIVWNAYQLTDDEKEAGITTPDFGSGLRDYKETRLNLLRWMRRLRPRQVKASKRWKITPQRTPSQLYNLLARAGEEGVVAKRKGGKESFKHKGVVYYIMPLIGWNISDAKMTSGLIKSLDVATQIGKSVTVGQGYTNKARLDLLKYMKSVNGSVEGLWVGFVGSKPTKPLEKGGSPSNSVFKFLATDPEGKEVVVEGPDISELT